MTRAGAEPRPGPPLVVYVEQQRPDLSPLDGPVRYAEVDELPLAIAGAELLLVWGFETAGEVARAAACHGQTLRWVHVNSVGVVHVLSDPLRERGLVVTNAGGVMDDAMAGFALAPILAMAKKIPTIVRNQAAARWRHHVSETIDSQTALVVGAGAIGGAVGRLLVKVGTAVVAAYDYVILTVPPTPQTRQMVNASLLSRMRPTTRLVNLGLGQLVDEDALISALERGGIAGAALDVFCHEPLPSDHRLWSLDQVVVSPHMAGDYAGWQLVQRDLFVENCRRYVEGRPLLNVIDQATGYVHAQAERYQRDPRRARPRPLMSVCRERSENICKGKCDRIVEEDR